MHRYTLSTAAVISRTLLASIGGYLLALSFSAGATAVLTRGFGMVRGEAFVLAAMLAFLVWMLAVLTAYAAATSWRAAAWIIGGAMCCAALGWLLGPLPAPGALQ
jgi:hypothetical protein